MTRTGLLAFGVVVVLALPGCGGGSSTASLTEAHAMIDRLEWTEGSTSFASTSPAFEGEMMRVEESLSAHLSSNPDDTQALLLSARLGRLQQMFEPLVLGADEPAPMPGERIESIARSIDMVLERQPDNAEAHFVKGRLFGMQRPIVRNGAITYQTVDLSKAIACVGIACELQPETDRFRTVLAQMMVSNDQGEEALSVLRMSPGADSAEYRLLSDFTNLPLPEGAVFLADESASFVRQQTVRGRIGDHGAWRARIYAVAMSASEVEDFYRSRWPSFELFAQAQPGLFTQFLTPDGFDFTPARSGMSVPTSAPSRPGIALRVIEVNNPPSEKWDAIAAHGVNWTKPANVISYIHTLNCRDVK